MDVLTKKTDARLHDRSPDTVERARQHVSEIIDMAEQDALDMMRSRAVEQEVLDMLDADKTG